MQIIPHLLKLKRIFKQSFVYSLDIIACIFSILLAYYIRLDITYIFSLNDLKLLLTSIFIFSFIFYFGGLYSTLFRYFGLNSIYTILKLWFLYFLIYVFSFVILNFYNTPRSIGLFQPIIFLFFVIFLRIIIFEIVSRISKIHKNKKLLIIGFSEEIIKLIPFLNSYEIINILDRSDDKIGKKFSNIEIKDTNELTKILSKEKITNIFLNSKYLETTEINSIYKIIENFSVLIRDIPDITKVIENSNFINEINKIKLNDLIPNKKTFDFNKLNNFYKNKNILITGAGGSIGSELTRIFSKLEVSNLILIDNSEYNLYLLKNELEEVTNINFFYILSDINDNNLSYKIQKIFNNQINHIFHTAAYKHVPMVEENIIAAIKNNFLGSLSIYNLSKKIGCKNILFISTDKAVRPTNIMGATKRLSELMFQCFSNYNDINITIVRFGNVIGSRGSVIPLFQKQINDRTAITVTHPDITRYLMSINDACNLVLEANIISSFEKKNYIYFLDMGKPVKILDIAKKMIKLSGLILSNDNNKSGDIEIKFIGLRKGEKLYEELVIGDDYEFSSNPMIYKCKEEFLSIDKIEKVINSTKSLIEDENTNALIDILNNNVEGFHKKIN